ncbi:LacI family DNA-binding transcriptional regulator [Paenarthrobacter sp. 22069]|uniref:LacI family DNA-binding transcriptional regulator n=1 Tax=Paenarthrobacter sp. 22069 TaxID=3453864 RepID=UPI003F82AD62
MTRSVRTADVAREAGVSRATVSYVLNDRRDVRLSETTRDHVLDVARRLGYVGSPAARALRSGRGDMVLLLLPEWDVAGQIALLLEEIGRLVSQHGLVCLRYEGPHWRGSLDRLLARIPAACVVSFDPLGTHDSQALRSSGVPEVPAWLLNHPGQPHTTAIDQEAIVEAQIDHLLQQRYKRLAYLAVEEPRGQEFTQARVGAFHDICRARGLSRGPSAVVTSDVESIAAILHSWTSSSAEPLGVAAWNDTTALGIVSAAGVCGLEVPHHIGVVGADDTMLASLARPSISSVRFNLASEAKGIAARISAALGQGTDETEMLPSAFVEIVPRASTAKTTMDG